MQHVQRYCDKMIGRNPHKCGDPAAENSSTVFAFDGKSYTTDLCSRHRGELETALQPYVAIAETVPQPRTNGSRGPYGGNRRKVLQTNDGTSFAARDVRDWMRKQGRDVPPSGRLPKDLIDAFMAAH